MGNCEHFSTFLYILQTKQLVVKVTDNDNNYSLKALYESSSQIKLHSCFVHLTVTNEGNSAFHFLNVQSILSGGAGDVTFAH